MVINDPHTELINPVVDEGHVDEGRDRLHTAHDRLTTIADTALDATVGEDACVQMAETFEEAAQTIAQGIPF